MIINRKSIVQDYFLTRNDGVDEDSVECCL